MYIEGMSTPTRVLYLLSALLPAITHGKSSDQTGDTCPASAVKSPAPACSTPIPSSEETVSFLLEVQGDDGKPLSNQQEAMEWVRLRLAMAGKQPDGITILPEGSHGVRVQLRGEAMQQADDLEAYLFYTFYTFRILPVHPLNDLLLADRYNATGVMQNMPGNARIMLQANPNDKLASEIIVQTDMEPERQFIHRHHPHEEQILRITTQPDIYGDNITIITLCPIHRYWSSPPITLCPFPNEPEINWIVPDSPFPHDTRMEYDPLTECRLRMHDKPYTEDFTITRDDIAKALVDQQDPTRIRIILTPAGQLKLQQYKDLMKPEANRLAVVMDNRIISTPVIHSKIDKDLSFSLDTPQRAQQTAQWLSAKNIYLVRVGQKEHTPVAASAE